mmetsp:Transcript_6621/g.16819  ORF Transcript_6621/g.16819 Transcript_6621/m.16819 type:complete len:580 (+) Transcript_6621:376-2115(+)
MFRGADAMSSLTLDDLCAHLLILVVRCEKDGSVVKAVRKLCRDFKMGGEALGVNFGMVLLGGATCETSKAQTKDTVFAAGRRLHAAMAGAGAVAMGDCLELDSELEDMVPKLEQLSADLQAVLPEEASEARDSVQTEEEVVAQSPERMGRPPLPAKVLRPDATAITPPEASEWGVRRMNDDRSRAADEAYRTQQRLTGSPVGGGGGNGSAFAGSAHTSPIAAPALARAAVKEALRGPKGAGADADAGAGGAGLPDLRSLPFTVVHSEDVAGDVAGQVMAGARARGFCNANVMSFSKFKNLKFDERKQVVIFVLQTIENGQPPENSGKCLRWLARKAHSPTMLEDALFFGVLGLGDSNLLLDRQTTTANDCNQAGQKLDKRLSELGAHRVCARGDADERTGFHEVDPWCEELWAQLAPDDLPFVSRSGGGSGTGTGGAMRAGGVGGTGSGGGDSADGGGGGGGPPSHPPSMSPMKDSSSSNTGVSKSVSSHEHSSTGATKQRKRSTSLKNVFPPAAPERPLSPMTGRNNSDQASTGIKRGANETEGGRGFDLSKELAVTVGAAALVVLGLVILSTRNRRP